MAKPWRMRSLLQATSTSSRPYFEKNLEMITLLPTKLSSLCASLLSISVTLCRWILVHLSLSDDRTASFLLSSSRVVSEWIWWALSGDRWRWGRINAVWLAHKGFASTCVDCCEGPPLNDLPIQPPQLQNAAAECLWWFIMSLDVSKRYQ